MTFPADGSVQITVPNVSSGAFNFAPSFSIQNNSDFTNQSGFSLNWGLDLKALTVSADFATAGSLNLGPVEEDNTPTANVSFPVTGAGSKFGLGTGSWALSGFGNFTGDTESILVDSVAPSTTDSLTGTPGQNGWFVGPSLFNLQATDDSSGVASTLWSDNGAGFSQWPGVPQNFSADGKYSLRFYSVDNAGNVESTKAAQLDLDQTPPVTTGAATGTVGTNGWFKSGSPAQLTLSPTDNLSGVAGTPYQVVDAATGSDLGGPQNYPGGPVAFTDGQYNVAYHSVDTAGNQESAHNIAFKVDQTAPVTTAAVTGTQGTNGWFQSGNSVQLTLSPSDNLSGVAVTQYQVADATTGATGAPQTYSGPVTFTDGVYTVSYDSVDKAGNTEQTKTISCKVDQTPPPIAVASRLPAANSDLWNGRPVTVIWNCADTLSGPHSPTVTQTLSQEGSSQTATGTCADQAGNTTANSVGDINSELTAPTLAYTGNRGTYTPDQTVNIACALTPGISPIVTSTCVAIDAPAYTFPLGSHTYTSQVTDQAGYSASATTTFTVQVTAGSLCALTKQFETNAGVAGALCAKLQNAEAKAGQGNGHPTQNMIHAFENQVSAQTGKTLTTAQAQILTSLAQSLAAQYQ